MNQESPGLKWIEALIYLQIDELLKGNRPDKALECVRQEGKKLPTQNQIRFRLANGQWIIGVSLGPQRLLIKTGEIEMTVVFDTLNGRFRFCESLKEIKTPVPGFKLEGEEDQGQRIFFEEAKKDQQGMLLKEALKAILGRKTS